MTKKQNKIKFESIFSSDHDWHCNACLNWSDEAFELYIIGYKQAADNLVEQIVKGGHDQDALVFPISFLYRQYIELRLKEIIKSGKTLLDEDGNFPQNHNIQHLYEMATTIANKVFLEEAEPPDLSLTKHVVDEFSKLDPNSFSFRYPIDKSGEKTLEGIKYINVRRLADYINTIAETFDTVSMGISYYMDLKSEYLSDI